MPVHVPSRHLLPLKLLCAALLAFAPLVAIAGGPKFVAGTATFNPGVAGQPVHWAGGQVNYYVDQGLLNGSVTHEQATAMIDAAAGLWSAVPTAGVKLTNMGTLNEDAVGANTVAVVHGQFTEPADLKPTAINYPLAIVFDADGAVIDTLFGTGTSDPTSCQNNGVLVALDDINPDATIAHAFILLNGRCAATPNLLQMMSFEVERAFGRILGLGYSQLNHACVNGTTQCTTYSAFGARPQYAALQAVSGTAQHISGVAPPSSITMRLLDMNGNAMAGGTVSLYEALYAWSPPRTPHMVCPPGVLLGTQFATATSTIDGMVTFSPLTMPGVDTNL